MAINGRTSVHNGDPARCACRSLDGRIGDVCTWLVLVLALALSNTLPVSAHEFEPRLTGSNVASRVLIVHSAHAGNAWTDTLMQGIEEVFWASAERPELWIEHMDARRVRDPRHLEWLAALYRRKYWDLRFDVVIATGNPALEFVLDHRESVFGDAPVVFAGLRGATPAALEEHGSVTGVMEADDFAAILDVAFGLHPAATELVVVAPGLRNRELFEPLVPVYRPELPLSFWSDDTLGALERRMKDLPASAIVLLLAEPTTPEGRLLPMTAFVRRMSELSPAPVYAARDSVMGHGIVGGPLASGRALGQHAARLGLRILGGTSADRLPIEKQVASRMLFDYRQLERFGVALSALPEGAVVIERPVGFYTRHRPVLLGAMGIIAVLGGFISVLLWSMRSRARAERAYREREQQLEAIFEHSPAEIYLKDLEGRYVRINRQFERQFAVRNEDLVGKFPDDVHYPELAQSTRAQDLAVLQSGEVVIREERARLAGAADDREHTLLTVKFPVRDASGAICGLGAIVTDISDRRAAQAALRKSEYRFRDFAEVAADWFWEMDENLHFTYVSGRHEYATGRGEQDILGKTRAELMSEVGIPEERESWRAHLEFLQAHDSFRDWVFTYVRPDGERRVVRISGKAVFDDRDRFLGYRGVGTDITVERHAQEALIERQRSEKETVQAELAAVRDELVNQTRFGAIGQVAASIAHDLRNPLGAIRNAQYYLRRRVPPEQPEWMSYLDILEHEVAAADHIIGELTEMAQDREPTRQRVDLGAAVADIYKRLDPGGEMVLECDLEPTPYYVHVDRGLFARVLDNLLSNAVQALGNGGRIRVSAHRANGDDCIRVRDDGPGIPAEIQARLFEPLVTSKAQGTGLGLAICRRIVERHGGSITVGETGASGTEFILRLPG